MNEWGREGVDGWGLENRILVLWGDGRGVKEGEGEGRGKV